MHNILDYSLIYYVHPSHYTRLSWVLIFCFITSNKHFISYVGDIGMKRWNIESKRVGVKECKSKKDHSLSMQILPLLMY